MTNPTPFTQVQIEYHNHLTVLENRMDVILWSAARCHKKSRLFDLAGELRKKAQEYVDFTGGDRYEVSSNNKGLRRIYDLHVSCGIDFN